MKNHTMIEDDRLYGSNPQGYLLKKERQEWIDNICIPCGHLYSIIVDVIGTYDNPKKFIVELNEAIEIGGNGFACVDGMRDEICFGNKAYYGLGRYLRKKHGLGKIDREALDTILSRIDGLWAH